MRTTSSPCSSITYRPCDPFGHTIRAVLNTKSFADGGHFAHLYVELREISQGGEHEQHEERPQAMAVGGGHRRQSVAVAAGQTNGSPERFTAMAVNMSRGGSGTVEIVVNRWSTDAERTKLMSTLMTQGDDKLLSVLQDIPRVGYFRSANTSATTFITHTGPRCQRAASRWCLQPIAASASGKQPTSLARSTIHSP